MQISQTDLISNMMRSRESLHLQSLHYRKAEPLAEGTVNDGQLWQACLGCCTKENTTLI